MTGKGELQGGGEELRRNRTSQGDFDSFEGGMRAAREGLIAYFSQFKG